MTEPQVARPEPFGQREWLLLFALFAALVVSYGPALNGAFLWDDAAHVTRPELQSWGGLLRIWFEPGATQQYYPLAHTAFWIQHRLWGDHPAGYHVVNLLLHFAAAVLAAVVLRRLRVPGAWLAAAIFALHPVHVESVAWITELKNTLSAVLYLGAALAWLRFEDGGKARFHAISLALFALALCSKTVTATLPAALLLVHWWQRGRPTWKGTVVPLLPFFILGAAAGLLTIQVERKLVGAEGAAFDLGFADRALIAGRALWFYAAKLAWPANLVFIYPRWHISAAAAWQFLYPAAALGAFAALWTLRKRWTAPLVAALFFAATLFPALGFFDVYPFLFSFVADHFQYLASLGLIALAAAGAARLVNRWPVPGRAVCLVWLAALATLTWRQSHLYGDRETLYRATIRGNPDCWMAHNNLAGVLIARGAASEAAEFARAALRMRPDYPEAHNNLALALASLGRADEAIPHYRKALELNPAYAEAHNNLGFALAGLGRVDAAIEEYRQSLRAQPDQAGTHFNLAMALVEKGDAKSAIAHLREAVSLQPDFAQAHNNLGILLARGGAHAEAVAEFRQALALEPDSREIRRNLDFALDGRRRP